MAAYVLAKRPFRGSTAVLIALLSTRMLPTPLLVIPRFVIALRLGWYDNFLGLIICTAGAIAALPTLVLFLVGQRHFVAGLTEGAVKQ